MLSNQKNTENELNLSGAPGVSFTATLDWDPSLQTQLQITIIDRMDNVKLYGAIKNCTHNQQSERSDQSEQNALRS